jgi:hypothetical protein
VRQNGWIMILRDYLFGYYKQDKWDVILGGGYNKYEGSHFGKVIWSRYASTSELGDRYYDDFAKKQMEIFSLKLSNCQ